MSANSVNTWQSVMRLCCRLHSDTLRPFYDQEWLQTTLRCISMIFELQDIDYALTNIYMPEPLWITGNKILFSIPAYSRLLNMPVSSCKSNKSRKFVHKFNIFDAIQAMNRYGKSRNYRENELVHKPMNNVEKTIIVMLVRVIVAVRHLYLHYRASGCRERGQLSNVKRLNQQHDDFPNIVFAEPSGSFDRPEIIGAYGLYDNRTGNYVSRLDYNNDDVYCNNRRANDRNDDDDDDVANKADENNSDTVAKRYRREQQKQRKRLFAKHPPKKQPPQHYLDYEIDDKVYGADCDADAAANNTDSYTQLSLDGIRAAGDSGSSSSSSSRSGNSSKKRRKFSLYNGDGDNSDTDDTAAAAADDDDDDDDDND